MVLIEGKEVIFSATFLATHDATVIIDSVPEIDAKALRFSFLETAEGDKGELAWGRDEFPKLFDIYITPSSSSTAKASPGIWHSTSNAKVLYTQYSQLPIGDKQSLIHFSILKDLPPVSGPASGAPSSSK